MMVVDAVIGKTALLVAAITPEQLSVAVGTGTSISSKAHCEVKSGSTATSGTGLVASVIKAFCVCVSVFPLASVYVHVITVDVVIGNTTLLVAAITPVQLSVAVGTKTSASRISHKAETSASVALFGIGVVMSSI